jgi:hypothetical protein
MHHTAGVAMYPGPSIGGLCRVDIPASNPPFSYASGPDPTTCWEGAWTSLSPETSDIATHMCN